MPLLDIEDSVTGTPTRGQTPLDGAGMDPVQTPVADDIQKQNALKYHFTLGENSPGWQNLMKSVQAGMDLQIQRQIAAQEDLKDANARNQILTEVAEMSAGKTIPPEVYDFVMGLNKKELQDPELRYIKAYANAVLNVPGPEYDFQEVLNGPDGGEDFFNKVDSAATHIAFNEHVHQVKAKLQAEWDTKGIIGKSFTHIERFVPFASYFNQRNTVEGPNVGSILLGNNKEEQIQRLFSLPLDQRVAAFNEAIVTIAEDNIVDAMEFADAVYRYTNDQSTLDNIFSPALDIADVAPVGLAAKAIKGARAVKAARGASKGMGDALEEAKVAGPKTAKTTIDPGPGTDPIVAGPKTANDSRLQALTEAARPDNPNIVADLMAASGKEKTAMAAKGLKFRAIEESPKPPQTKAQIEEVESFVPSLVDTKVAAQTAVTGKIPLTKLTAQGALRVADSLREIDSLLGQAIQDSANITTRIVSEDMLKMAWKNAELDFQRQHPQTNSAILDSLTYKGRPEESKANTAFIVTYMGRPDKTLFAQPSHAHNFAKNHYNLLPGYEVVPLNGKYAIKLQSYVDETKLWEFKYDTTDPTPRSLANTLLGYFRTSDDLLNRMSAEQRKRVTHAYSLLQNLVKEAAKPITELSKRPGRLARFEKVLEAGMHHKVPTKVQWMNKVTGQLEEKNSFKIGINYSREQFEQKYYELNGMMPGEKEVLAYETYKKLLDFDYVIRNLDLTRDKVRLGIQQIQFDAFVASDQVGGKIKTATALFDGKIVDSLPYGHPSNSRVALYSDEDGFAHVYDVNTMSANNKEFVQKLVDEKGYRIVNIANPNVKPLREYLGSEEAIEFVVVKAPKVRPLGLTQIPKQEGGHRITREGTVFIKAPIVTKPTRKVRDAEGNVAEQELERTYYEGDLTLFGVHSEAKAREMIPHFSKVRDLFLQGKQDEFMEYAAKHVPNDPVSLWNDFENKTIPTNVDYYVVKSGQGINDIPEFKGALHSRYPDMVDTIDSEFNLYRLINKKFAGQRNPDLFSWETKGYDEGNPVVKFQSARYVQPIDAMQSSMATLMRNRAYSDYIIRATESWIEEFKGLLKTDPRVLRANPLHHLHNPEWVDKPTDRAMYMAAQNSRRALIQLLGSHSELRNNLEWVKGKIVDQAYKMVGDSTSEKLADALLPTSNDPLAYVRGAAFHMKLGLLNPVQMFTQSQTLFHMTAITGNPVRAGRSFVGATYMQMLQNATSPKIIDHVASLAAKTGYGSAKEFKESYELLQKTGLWFVEGEHGWRNDTLDPKMFTGAIGRGLDKGTLFFKGTERFVRLASWNIAYKEFRGAKGPFALIGGKDAPIGPRELEKILLRQNDLAVNMTNDSAAALQRGVFSLTTQFFGYQFRILDQVLGKRLTPKERLRLVAMYSTVYGVPIGAGAGMLTPWYGDIKDYAANDLNLQIDEGAWQLFFDGALSFVTEGITGDPYNPAKRYGPGGLELLKTVFDEGPSEDTLLSILGASASIFGDAVRWAMPAVTSAWSQVWSDEADQVPLQQQEFIDAFRSISTVNNAVKAYMAYYAHAYYTRDGQKIADATDTDAIMTAIFGLSNSHIEKMYQQMEELREDRAAREILQKEYLSAMRDAARATTAEDRQKLYRKARIYKKSANLTTREAAGWFSRAVRGDEELYLQIDREYRRKFDEKLYGGE